MAENPNWYSTDLDLHTRTHETVGFGAAVAIIGRYFGDLKPHYERGEEALAATSFGFSRGENEFIRICVHGPDRASVSVELPGPKLPWYLLFLWPWLNVYQHHEERVSKEGVEERVRQFFTLTAEEFRARLRGGDRSA